MSEAYPRMDYPENARENRVCASCGSPRTIRAYGTLARGLWWCNRCGVR